MEQNILKEKDHYSVQAVGVPKTIYGVKSWFIPSRIQKRVCLPLQILHKQVAVRAVQPSGAQHKQRNVPAWAETFDVFLIISPS